MSAAGAAGRRIGRLRACVRVDAELFAGERVEGARPVGNQPRGQGPGLLVGQPLGLVDQRQLLLRELCTEIHSPSAIEKAPASKPASPATSAARPSVAAPTTPITSWQHKGRPKAPHPSQIRVRARQPRSCGTLCFREVAGELCMGCEPIPDRVRVSRTGLSNPAR